MTLRKLRETVATAPKPNRAVRVQPPYHHDIDGDYLVALQKQVDSRKPSGFQLTPISEAGW